MSEAERILNRFNVALRKYREENLEYPTIVVCGRFDYDSLLGCLRVLLGKSFTHVCISRPIPEYLGVQILYTTNADEGFFFAGNPP
jgi:hypothetical protein